MSIKNYTSNFNTQATPQTEPIPGKKQVQNSAGGFTFAVDDWTRLNRFLILGSEGGSYYATEKKLTRENAEAVIRCISNDGIRTVDEIVKVSDAGRAPKNDPAIFALALALKLGDAKTRKAAQAAVTKVCRIGTHLFALAEAVKSLGGWGRGTKKAFAEFYTSRSPEALAGQLTKYQSRNGWAHRDILRKLHLKPKDEVSALAFKWAVGKASPEEMALTSHAGLRMIQGFELAKAATSDLQVAQLIADYNLPRECVPTQYLNSVEVWDALLRSGRGMPMTAMIRNLAKMTSVGLLKPFAKEVKLVTDKLRDQAQLKDARVHPLHLLQAMRTYGQGHGEKGSLSWTPVPQISEALEDAFYLSFGAIEPAGKNFLLGLDVSGSMGAHIPGYAFSCAEVSTVMAMVTARTEKSSYIHGFATTFKDLGITAKDSLQEAMRKTSNQNFGGTDCSQPMEYAIKNKLEADVFVVYTDNETYAGRRHPVQALKAFRQKMGRDAKLIVCGLVSNGFSIADPDDAGMLDVAGYDSAVPAVISDFSR